ncbi:unannotated protein [freshwater metagenome]|uniref:Unannotated protein n=1 Tax=freshwater metagenome TaxID=449393 RepID=A0A6J7E4V3_9ZZZZ
MSPWRHVLVALVIIGCSALALLGIIGGGLRPERFDAKQITVQPIGENGVRIREVVDEDFGYTKRHGYQRLIPNDFGEPTDITASSPDANAEVGVTQLGNETRLRLGDPNSTVTGQHRYVLTYTLPDARLSTGQLALDIIAAGEKFETGRFEVIVTGMTLTDPTCNVGSAGTTGGCALAADGSTYSVVFEPLQAGQGVTIGGAIQSISATEAMPALPPLPPRRADHRLLLALVLLPIGLAGAAGVFFLDRRKGRNEVFSGGAAEAAYGTLPAPNTDGTPSTVATSLVADDRMAAMATIEFVPPKGVQPWQGAVLLTEQINDSTVSAWFSGLVAHEAITLDKLDGKLVMGSGPKRASLDPTSAAHIDRILQGRDTLQLGGYDPEFAATWKTVKAEQVQAITNAGWWKRLPASAGGGGGGLSAALLVVIVAIVVFGGASAMSAALGAFHLVALALAFGLLVPMLFAFIAYAALLPALSATGSALALRTESFRRFLIASEGKHVEWAWKQGLLREYSAWAVSLGAAEAWGKALANSNVPASELGLGNPLLVYSMASVLSSARTAPSSSGSSGFSGFSGGSVGGGGGGGSSGSW